MQPTALRAATEPQTVRHENSARSMNEKEPSTLTLDEIEEIEKLTLRWIFQAVLDFGMEAHEIFLKSPDRVKDIAEDITRELLDRLPGYNVPQRIYGTVDYKKARYVILPDQTVRQALFIESKAEEEHRSATIQMSQTSPCGFGNDVQVVELTKRGSYWKSLNTGGSII